MVVTVEYEDNLAVEGGYGGWGWGVARGLIGEETVERDCSSRVAR